MGWLFRDGSWSVDAVEKDARGNSSLASEILPDLISILGRRSGYGTKVCTLADASHVTWKPPLSISKLDTDNFVEL